MIGNCDACDRQNVPVSNGRSSSGETTQCYLCQGDSSPDPYGELANHEALRLLAAEDACQDKLHELLETIREQIRLEIQPENRPDGLFKNIQDAVYAMRGRTRLMDDVAITSPLTFTPAQGWRDREPLIQLLMRCRTVLGNMALENETGLNSIFNRWPISHEPLRADAKGLVPLLDEALSQHHQAAMTEIRESGELCIICANGNDLPDGEQCPTCGRGGTATGLRAAVIKARGRMEPPKVPVKFGTHERSSAATGDEPDSRLPLQYEDGPDYCTVKDAQGRDFALTMQPELMQAMERALREDIALLSRPPVTAIEPQEAWQPMETAPRDGSQILATGGGLSDTVDVVAYTERVGAWNATHFTLDDRDDEPDGYSRPTHWLPIPTLPSSVTRPQSGGGQ